MSALPDMDDMEELWDNSKGLLIPGMAAGTAGAGLGAYLTSKKKRGETPSERRRRVVRNALVGAAAGTSAGIALPAGVNMLNEVGSGGVIGDTVEDLITNTAVLGAGGAAGYAGGTWAKDKLLNHADEAMRVNTATDDLYRLMGSGQKAPSMVQFFDDSNNGSVKEKLRQLAGGAHANTQQFYDEALKKTETEIRRKLHTNEITRLKDSGLSTAEARRETAKLLRRDSVKASISMQAESSLRRTMSDIGLTAPTDSIEAFLKRLKDPNRWSSRADAAKRLLGMKGLGDAGRIWGSMPTDSGKWKSVLRRLVKGTVPGVGLAAGGLLASNFI